LPYAFTEYGAIMAVTITRPWTIRSAAACEREGDSILPPMRKLAPEASKAARGIGGAGREVDDTHRLISLCSLSR
jgi:hypothetical protein